MPHEPTCMLVVLLVYCTFRLLLPLLLILLVLALFGRD